MNIDINECPRCKNAHANVEIRPFVRSQPAAHRAELLLESLEIAAGDATGWGMCPALEEPFFVC
jgi:hypothetical protein